VQFALPEPIRNVKADFHRAPLRWNRRDADSWCRFRAFARRYTRCAILEKRIVRFGLDPPRLAGWKSLCHCTIPRLTSLFHEPGTAAGFHVRRKLRERVLLRDRSPVPPESPGFPLRDSVRSSKTKTRDAYRRTAPTEPLLLRASARSESWSHFGRSAITLRIPFRFGQSRRARQRLPSSFTSAETAFFPLSRTGGRPRYVLPTNATQNLTNCTRARCFVRSVDPICASYSVKSSPGQKNRDGRDRCVSRRLRSLRREPAVFALKRIRPQDLHALRLSRFVTCFRHGLRLFERLTMH
jgi:hypothetical protein